MALLAVGILMSPRAQRLLSSRDLRARSSWGHRNSSVSMPSSASSKAHKTMALREDEFSIAEISDKIASSKRNKTLFLRLMRALTVSIQLELEIHGSSAWRDAHVLMTFLDLLDMANGCPLAWCRTVLPGKHNSSTSWCRAAALRHANWK